MARTDVVLERPRRRDTLLDADAHDGTVKNLESS